MRWRAPVGLAYAVLRPLRTRTRFGWWVGLVGALASANLLIVFGLRSYFGA